MHICMYRYESPLGIISILYIHYCLLVQRLKSLATPRVGLLKTELISMIITYIIVAALVLAIWILLRRINRKYFILSLTRRVQTLDGSPLGSKVFVQPGKTVFGNNLDLRLMTPRKLIYYNNALKLIIVRVIPYHFRSSF